MDSRMLGALAEDIYNFKSIVRRRNESMAKTGLIRLGQIAALVILVMLIWAGIAAGADSTSSAPSWDWLGGGPIYSFGDYYSPYYYPFVYPYSGSAYPVYSYSPSPAYTNYPIYYDEPYWISPAPASYYTNYIPIYPSWVGTHKDLDKVMQIAKTSSVKIYSNGAWQSP